MKTIEYLNEKLGEEGVPTDDVLFVCGVYPDIVHDAGDLDIQVVTWMAGDWDRTAVVVVPDPARPQVEDVIAYGPQAARIMKLLSEKDDT